MNYVCLENRKDTERYLINGYKSKNVLDFINEFIKEEDGQRVGIINIESKYYSRDISFEFGKADIPTERYVIGHKEDGCSYWNRVQLRLQDFWIYSVMADCSYGTWIVYVKAGEPGEEMPKYAQL